MKKTCTWVGIVSSALVLSACGSSNSDSNTSPLSSIGISHALLISIDGLHQQDVANCISSNTCPNIASLANTGVTYTGANTPGLSDSVPGLAALVTGGSPKTTGLFYDDIYDRTLYSGVDLNCTGTQGVEVFLQEQVGIDGYNGGALAHLDGGGDFNPQQIPRRKNASGACLPVYPHEFTQTNTIFEVVRQNIPGAFTAWADKHAWGTDWVNGPSGTGVNDFARTEINSDYNTARGQTTPAGYDFTNSPTQTKVFDHYHTQIVINQIDGLDSTGVVSAAMGGALQSNKIPVPTLFGTNYQTLSVSQKALNVNGGGYTDANFTPNTLTADAIKFLDGEIGAIKTELANKNLLSSTVIIITAKHGQTPADRSKLRKIGDTIASTLTAANLGANSVIGSGADAVTGNALGTGQFTEDDVGFIWLNSQSDAARASAVAALKANIGCPAVDPNTKIIVAGQVNPGICAGVDAGSAVIDLKADGRFGDPTLGRTPDIMVQPNFGVIYSKSGKKDAEHGGAASTDTGVGLIVSNPALAKQTVATQVLTTQVAPTIIQALKLDPNLLNSVKSEGTAVLPNLF
ncbi:MAG TPA: alkaline phosphatase family protein [Methylibium sp.]